MKKILSVLLLITTTVIVSPIANAFFIFIPGSLIRAVGDSITGAKGNICVKEGSKAGDILDSPAGNTATITSVSGTSAMCKDPALPIRAELEYKFNFKSTAGINLTSDYEAKTLTDLQRHNGTLLIAAAKSTANKGVQINGRQKNQNTDPQTIASSFEIAQKSALATAETKNAEKLVINAANAWRFEVHGKLKGIFGVEVVYLLTVLEGDNEVLIINTYTSASNFENQKEEMRQVAYNITGIKSKPVAEQKIDAIPSVSVDTNNAVVPPTATNNSSAEKIRELAKLLNEGLITKEDYESKKSELLKGM